MQQSDAALIQELEMQRNVMGSRAAALASELSRAKSIIAEREKEIAALNDKLAAVQPTGD